MSIALALPKFNRYGTQIRRQAVAEWQSLLTKT